MSLNKFLERVGLVEVVEVKEEPTSQTTAPAPDGDIAKASPKVAPFSQDPDAQARIAELDKSAREKLHQAMDDAGAKLVEEFGDLLDTLKESIADEKVRYTAALKILIKKGNTVTAVCADIDKCIGVLEEKDREFTSQLKDQLDKRVGSRKAQVEGLQKTIEDKSNQIVTLEREIKDLSGKRDVAFNEITEEQMKLTQVQERFTLAYQAIKAEAQLQRGKIVQYGESL